MQTRRQKLEEDESIREEKLRQLLSNPKLLQAFGPQHPLEARQLALALKNRDLYKEVMAVVPPRGDYRYGEDLEDVLDNNIDITEDVLLNTILRKYKRFNSVTNTYEETRNPYFTSHNAAALRFCAERGYERCVKQLLEYDENVQYINGKPLFYDSIYGGLNIIKMLIKKGAIVNEENFLDAARSPRVSGDVLRYFISLNESLIYARNFSVIRNIAISYRLENENDKIEIMKYVYEIVKRDNRLNQFPVPDAIGSALENLIVNNQPTPIILDFFTMILNDGFNVNWGEGNLLSAAFFNNLRDALLWVQFLLSKGATVRRKHIKNGTRSVSDFGDARILQLLLANVPDPLNIPI